MPRSLHLHVGLPKCGSSSLQAFLCDKVEEFRRLGCDYPLAPHNGIGNATAFVMSSVSPKERVVFSHHNPNIDLETARKDLLQAMVESPHSHVILSSEGLNRPFREAPIWDFTASFDAVLAHMFMRPREAWLLSNYTQSVKTGFVTTDFDGYVSSISQRNRAFPEAIYFARMFAFWEDLLGRGNVRPYFLGPGHVGTVEQFVEGIGLSPEQFSEAPPASNQSPSAFETCVLASVERSSPADFLKIARPVRWIARQHDPFADRTLMLSETHAFLRETFLEDTNLFLEMQDKVTRDDLEPPFDPKGEPISFEEIRESKEFATVIRLLSERSIVVSAA